MHHLFVLTLLVIASAGSHADAVVSTDSLEAVSIHGVRLGMSDARAFTTLSNAGHKAGPIQLFEEWTGEGLEMVRGDGQAPEGESRIVIVRRHGEVIQLTETFIRTRGERFNPEQEINRLQQTLGLSSNDPHCRITRSGGGLCEAIDHPDPNKASTSLSFSVTPIMIQRVLLRRDALQTNTPSP